MLVAKEFQKLFQQLIQGETTQYRIDGIDILLRLFDNSSKLFISAPIYEGSNFIPTSVRACVSQIAPFAREDHIHTYLTVDEEHFKVFLNCVSGLDSFYNETLKYQLEEFSWLADKWRVYLDEHDKNDLVYVRAK